MDWWIGRLVETDGNWLVLQVKLAGVSMAFLQICEKKTREKWSLEHPGAGCDKQLLWCADHTKKGVFEHDYLFLGENESSLLESGCRTIRTLLPSWLVSTSFPQDLVTQSLRLDQTH